MVAAGGTQTGSAAQPTTSKPNAAERLGSCGRLALLLGLVGLGSVLLL